jgi:hypothetical protein
MRVIKALGEHPSYAHVGYTAQAGTKEIEAAGKERG